MLCHPPPPHLFPSHLLPQLYPRSSCVIVIVIIILIIFIIVQLHVLLLALQFSVTNKRTGGRAIHSRCIVLSLQMVHVAGAKLRSLAHMECIRLKKKNSWSTSRGCRV